MIQVPPDCTDPEKVPPERPWWRRPQVWVGFALSGLAVGTFLTLFDFGKVYASLSRVIIHWCLLSAAIFLGVWFVVRPLRWQLLLRPMGRYGYGVVRDVQLTGFMVNNLLPARLGEIARALVLWKVTGASRRGALTTIGIERLFDGLVLIGLLSLVGLLFDVPPWTRRLGHVTVVVLAGLAGLVGWLTYAHRSLLWVLERALFFLPVGSRKKTVSFFERFVEGSGALRSPALTLGALALSMLVWSLEIGVYHAMLRGFGISLPLWAAALTLVVTNFGIAVPSAPAGLGVYEAACSGALIAVGLDKELALSYAIGLHLMMFVCITGSGLVLMWRLGLKLGDVTRGSSRPARSSD